MPRKKDNAKKQVSSHKSGVRAHKVETPSSQVEMVDKFHQVMMQRCADLKEANEKLLLAIDGWRRLCEGQGNELKALRLTAFLIDSPGTALGQARAELRNSQAAATIAQEVVELREKQMREITDEHNRRMFETHQRHKKLSLLLEERIAELESKKKHQRTQRHPKPALTEQEVSIVIPGPPESTIEPEPIAEVKRSLFARVTNWLSG